MMSHQRHERAPLLNLRLSEILLVLKKLSLLNAQNPFMFPVHTVKNSW